MAHRVVFATAMKVDATVATAMLDVAPVWIAVCVCMQRRMPCWRLEGAVLISAAMLSCTATRKSNVNVFFSFLSKVVNIGFPRCPCLGKDGLCESAISWMSMSDGYR